MTSRLSVSLFKLLLIVSYLAGNYPLSANGIHYNINWEQPNRHYYSVSIVIPRQKGRNIQVRMPAWRPGRYLIQNFSAAVVDFRAATESGEKLAFRKSDKDTWTITNDHKKTTIIQYKVYANTLDAGSSYLQETEAFINPITLLMYVSGKEDEAVKLTVKQPENWKLASALQPGTDGSMTAESYHQLVDSPLLLSPELDLLSFDHDKTRIEIAIQGQADYDRQPIIDDFKAIVATQSRIMGGLPIDDYLFLIHLVDFGFGHGVEHANSTSLVVGPADFTNARFYQRLIAVAAHEFFHLWNVKRIRPASLNPPDYARENYTSLMWFFEGVTSYYEELTLVRAGLIDDRQYVQGLQRSINRHLRNYGRFITSASESSWNSWNKSAEAPPFTEISVYTKGKLLGFLLDMEIRRVTSNQKSLDDVMLLLWKKYGQSGKGLTENAIKKAVESVSTNNFDLFFIRYVDGTAELPFDSALAVAGLDFVKPDPGEYPAAYLGIRLDSQEKIDRIYPDSPALDGGLDLGDRMIAIDQKEATVDNLDKLLSAYQPSDSIQITVIRRKMLREFTVALGQQPYHEGWIVRPADAEKDSTSSKIYTDWLWMENSWQSLPLQQ